jgi:hypothetical protein
MEKSNFLSVNADVQVRDLLLFRSALDQTAVEDLHLWGRGMTAGRP